VVLAASNAPVGEYVRPFSVSALRCRYDTPSGPSRKWPAENQTGVRHLPQVNPVGASPRAAWSSTVGASEGGCIVGCGHPLSQLNSPVHGPLLHPGRGVEFGLGRFQQLTS
jgi:hypothetical protein